MREQVLAKMVEVMGPLPGDERRVALDVRIEREEERDGVRWQRISYASEPGDRVSAWLALPAEGAPQPEGDRQQRRRPAMLCLHQTTKIGKDEPAGLGGKPNLHYASELARRGYITLSPDYPGYGEYHVDAYAMGYVSATMKGIWNHIRAMDLLCAHPAVDAARIGCIGHSLGGHNTLFVAAFEPRIRAAVSSCGFTLFTCNRRGGEPGGALADIADWSHAGYMPRIATRYNCDGREMPFDWNEVLSVIAPRAVFINAPESDDFLVDGVRQCVQMVAPLYRQAGASSLLEVRHPPGGHDFPAEVRQYAYQFLDRVLA